MREGEVGGNAHGQAGLGKKEVGPVGSVTPQSREAQTATLREGSELVLGGVLGSLGQRVGSSSSKS